jgi:putative hydrolase of the HAD superfamily
VRRPEACLIDVYSTILTCDFMAHRIELPILAGVAADDWRQGYGRIDCELNTGRLSKAEGFEHIVRECGGEAGPDLVRALVDKDRELLLATARLYDDAIGFLEKLRADGVKIAIVSNCSEHTRLLLTELGVDALTDTLVLSCEVGSAKPEAGIFRHALTRLGVTPEAAVFIDDQAGFCAGAVAEGIRAVQIVRAERAARQTPVSGIPVVRSLAEVQAMFWA